MEGYFSSAKPLDEELDPEHPNFVDNFNKLVEESHKRWLEKIKENPNYPEEEENTSSRKKTKKKLMENIFKEHPTWKPPFVYGKEFDKFKRLIHERQMTNWEIVSFIKLKPNQLY